MMKNWFLLLLFSITALTHTKGQDQELPGYTRPSYKVYKSLSAALANPDSVFILDLRGKKLTEFPEAVYKLPHLLVLDISRNKIKTLPADISKMESLEELDLSGNKLTELPASIGDFKWLKKLALNRNTLVTLPPTIGNIATLEYLELWDNELEDLPDEIKNLKKLRILELRGILFSEEQQTRFRELVPNARVYMSPSCNCKL